jgi:hypothetical protein
MLALVLLAGSAGWLSGGSLRAEEPRAVIDKAVQATGGEAALKQIHATQVKLKGTLHEVDGATFTGTILAQLPDQFKWDLQLDVNGTPSTLVQVLNGKKGWLKDTDLDQEVPAATLAEWRHAGYVDYVATLVPLLSGTGFKLTANPAAKVRGRPATGVLVTSPGKPVVELYFDQTTGLLIKTSDRRMEGNPPKNVLWEQYYDDYRDVNPAAADEQVLKAAKVATDGPALLDYLKRRTMDDARREKIAGLIRQLGDNSFEVREKAKEELAAQGEQAVPILAQALKDPDPEIASRAKECLDRISKAPDPGAPAAVVRLIAQQKPAGAAEVLLAYLPSAPDESVAHEVRAALAAVAYRDGNPDKALVQAVEGKDAARKTAASAALGTDAKAARERAGQRLFLAGVKYPMKGAVERDGVKVMEWEFTDVQFFNRLDDHVFAKP